MKITTVFWVLVSVVFLWSCKAPKEPTFESMENLKLKSLNRQTLTFTSDIILNNPNSFSCRLKNLELEVFTVKDKKLSEIKQTFNTEMPANSTFTLPVQIGFSTNKLLDERFALLESAVSALGKREIDLKFKGHCQIEVLEITLKIPIEFEEKMPLKR